MYNHYGVTTLDDLIENIHKKMGNPNYDNLYLKRLEEFLKHKREEYGNVHTVAASLPMKFNKKDGDEIFEDIKWKEKNKIGRILENMEISKTKSKKYFLISFEYYNDLLILIVGKPDGLHFGGKWNDEVDIYEVKSFSLRDFYARLGQGGDEDLVKKIHNIIKTISNQLKIYQYLLEKTEGYKLIGKIKNIKLHGIIYLYSEDIGDLYHAKRIIKYMFNIIISDAYRYNVYNLRLKKEGTIDINNNTRIYYLEIDFRVKYSQETIKIYFNDLNKLLKSLKLLDNRSL
jgi:hypothetical protein